MAQRPVFLPNPDGPLPVRKEVVDFTWFPGLSLAQQQKSIDALHAAARTLLGIERVLEISGKSREPLGAALSAFNLRLAGGISVECAFQGSKCFERGGPWTDLYDKPSREAKRDEQLKNSGRLTGFRWQDQDWPLTPPTAFYDWLWCHALHRHPDLATAMLAYPAFTDIAFNPVKSRNCQAGSAALYAALSRHDLLDRALSSRDSFLSIQTGLPASCPD